MIETPMDWDQAIGDLLAALGHRVDAVYGLRAMSTSRAWRVETDLGSRVVRVAFPRSGKTPRFRTDAAVRARLAPSDDRIACPVAHGDDRPELSCLVDGRDWAVDVFLPGTDGARETVNEAIWADLGGLLAKIHRLPSDGVEGTAESRYQQAWPLHSGRLSEHPIAKLAPRLPKVLAGLKADITRATHRSAGIVHGDAAPYNLRLLDGKLMGLIDFNDTFVGSPAWDFAWIAAYSGWPAVEATLAGYDQASDEFRADIRLLAIPTALHGASRAALLDQGDRMARMVAFLGETLAMSFPP